MSITIASNIASLGAQRQLGKASESLSNTFERLSSGMRINRASDDAAGLAIATSLNANARVYSQSIRNINDAISASNIAMGATSQLTSIVTRLQELATQSANGTLKDKQRKSLDTEAQSLRAEFNRIIETTSFNGIRLIDEFTNSIRIQAGDTSNFNSLNLNSSNLGTSKKGTGSFTQSNYTGVSGVLYATSAGDLNNDGILDMVTSSFAGVSQIYIGNQDGSFAASVTINQGTINQSNALGDMNGDGNIDLVLTDNSSGISIYYGNGDGSFKARTALSAALTGQSLQLEDLDGNGSKDIVFASVSTNTVQVIMSNGDGTYSSMSSFSASNPYSIAIGDIDGDGKKDLSILNTTGEVYTRRGNGDGTFQGIVTLSGAGNGGRSIAFGDINQDGRLDIISSNHTGGTITINLNQANGTFSAGVSYAASADIGAINIYDYDGDSVLDIVANDNTANVVQLYKGYRSGSIGTGTNIATGISAPVLQFVTADFDGDGAKDIGISNSFTGVSVLKSNSINSSRLAELDLSTKTGALVAIRSLNTSLTNLLQGIGRIGADESRFRVALNVVAVSRENYIAGASRILDSDVATESSELTRLTILQQASAAILGQANLKPNLALQLLR